MMSCASYDWYCLKKNAVWNFRWPSFVICQPSVVIRISFFKAEYSVVSLHLDDPATIIKPTNVVLERLFAVCLLKMVHRLCRVLGGGSYQSLISKVATPIERMNIIVVSGRLFPLYNHIEDNPTVISTLSSSCFLQLESYCERPTS